MGRKIALHVATKVTVVKRQLDKARGLHNIEGPQGSLDTVAGIRAKGEVGVQRDSQDFRSSVQWGHLVANSHIRMETRTGGYPR